MGFFYFVGAIGADEYFDAVKTIRLDLLNLLGSGYVVEHCVSAFRIKAREEIWKGYIAEGVKILTENTSLRGGAHLAKSYRELIDTKKEPEKTGDEIVREIINRAGLKVKT